MSNNQKCGRTCKITGLKCYRNVKQENQPCYEHNDKSNKSPQDIFKDITSGQQNGRRRNTTIMPFNLSESNLNPVSQNEHTHKPQLTKFNKSLFNTPKLIKNKTPLKNKTLLPQTKNINKSTTLNNMDYKNLLKNTVNINPVKQTNDNLIEFNHNNDYINQSPIFKLLLIGDKGVGKSSLLLRYTDNKTNCKMLNINNKLIQMQIQDRLENFDYSDMDGIIIIQDITDVNSYYNVHKYYNEIPDKSKIILVGNKTDILGKREVSYDEGKELADVLKIQFQETSAKSGLNIDQIFLSFFENKDFNNKDNVDQVEIQNTIKQADNLIEKLANNNQFEMNKILKEEDNTKKINDQFINFNKENTPDNNYNIINADQNQFKQINENQNIIKHTISDNKNPKNETTNNEVRNQNNSREPNQTLKETNNNKFEQDKSLQESKNDIYNQLLSFSNKDKKSTANNQDIIVTDQNQFKQINENQNIINHTNEEISNNNQVNGIQNQNNYVNPQINITDSNLIQTQSENNQFETNKIIDQEHNNQNQNQFTAFSNKYEKSTTNQNLDMEKDVKTEISKTSQGAKNFKDLLSQLNLKDVIEKVVSKYASVRHAKFENWINTFIGGLNKLDYFAKTVNMLNVIESDLKNLLNQNEHECVFQGKDFVENNQGTTIMLSIYIAVLKTQEKYEINQSYKVLSWTEQNNFDFKLNEIIQKEGHNYLRHEALNEFKEVFEGTLPENKDKNQNNENQNDYQINSKNSIKNEILTTNNQVNYQNNLRDSNIMFNNQNFEKLNENVIINRKRERPSVVDANIQCNIRSQSNVNHFSVRNKLENSKNDETWNGFFISKLNSMKSYFK